jgi:hypothetical protein
MVHRGTVDRLTGARWRPHRPSSDMVDEIAAPPSHLDRFRRRPRAVHGRDMQHLPALVVASPQRTVVRPTGTADTIGDLAAAFDADATSVAIGGQVHAPSTSLVEIPALRHGVAVELAAAAGRVADDRSRHPADGAQVASAHAVVEVAVVLGPDCQPWRPLAPGRYIVGRAADAHLTITDPTVEPYQALVTVAPRADTDNDRSQPASPSAWTLRQLTGGVDIDERTTSIHHLSTTTIPQRGQAGDTSVTLYRMGASTLAIRQRAMRPDADLGCDHDDVDPPRSRIVRRDAAPWQRVVLRSPVPPRHRRPKLEPPVEPEPIPWPSGAGLIGAGAAVAGAAAIAGVLGQPTLALFALVGGFVALTTWAVGVVGTWRRRRRAGRRHAAALERFDIAHRAAVAAARADHVADHPAVTDVLGQLDRLGAQLDRGDTEIGAPIWSRPLTSADRPRPATSTPVASIGFGDVELDLGGGDHHRARDLALPIRFAPGSLTAVCGPGASALGRASRRPAGDIARPRRSHHRGRHPHARPVGVDDVVAARRRSPR